MTIRHLRSTLDFLLVACIGILVVGAINWYPLLPEKIVMHMNAAGEPDGWATRTMLTWGLLPAIAVVLTTGLKALIRWIEGAAAKNPTYINVPDRGSFLALSTGDRRVALRPTAIYLRYVAVLVLFLFIYIQEGLGRLSTGRSETWSSFPVVVILLGIIGGVPLLLRSTRRLIHGLTTTPAGDHRDSTSE